ncbi:MAG: hypothetical protein LBS74_03535 [Oscillospiraceae bacterium]|jgi:hypothetical protein|nr:hypothetical protein [Oscillospiraceae bacterium]
MYKLKTTLAYKLVLSLNIALIPFFISFVSLLFMRSPIGLFDWFYGVDRYYLQGIPVSPVTVGIAFLALFALVFIIVLLLPFKSLIVDEAGLKLYSGSKLVNAYDFEKFQIYYKFYRPIFRSQNRGFKYRFFRVIVKSDSEIVYQINLRKYSAKAIDKFMGTLILQKNAHYAGSFKSNHELKEAMPLPFIYNLGHIDTNRHNYIKAMILIPLLFVFVGLCMAIGLIISAVFGYPYYKELIMFAIYFTLLGTLITIVFLKMYESYKPLKGTPSAFRIIADRDAITINNITLKYSEIERLYLTSPAYGQDKPDSIWSARTIAVKTILGETHIFIVDYICHTLTSFNFKGMNYDESLTSSFPEYESFCQNLQLLLIDKPGVFNFSYGKPNHI